MFALLEYGTYITKSQPKFSNNLMTNMQSSSDLPHTHLRIFIAFLQHRFFNFGCLTVRGLGITFMGRTSFTKAAMDIRKGSTIWQGTIGISFLVNMFGLCCITVGETMYVMHYLHIKKTTKQ